MKNIEIWVIGRYDYNTRRGTWIYYLNYKGAVIKRSGCMENAGSPNRITLIALYNALAQVNQPCNIIIHSKSALGFKRPKQSHNKDLLISIQTLINNAGHLVKFDTKDDFYKVKTWEQVYGTKTDGTKTKLKEDNITNIGARQQKTFKPDINGKKNAEDVFKMKKHEEEEYAKRIEEQAMASRDWREMYSDLMTESNGNWVSGSGGY